MSDRYTQALREHVAMVLNVDGDTAPALRRAAAENGELPAELKSLVETIHQHAYKVSDENIEALKARYSDDELFEIIVSAAVGASLARLERGMQALKEVVTRD